MKAIALIASCLALALAQSAAAEGPVPKPKLRPPAEQGRSAGAEQPPQAPIPRLRPPRQVETAVPETPPGAPPPQAPDTRGWPPSTVSAEREACRALLAGRAIDYQPLGPLGAENSCGAPAPISVRRVAGVAVSPPATLTCDMASALHDWITGTVQPAARKRLGTEVTEINAGTSYACRRRNNAASGKLSEHGRANALDMAGFSFARRTDVAVDGSGSWGEGLLDAIGLSKNGSFLDDIRKGACAHFTTVLGPGSDPYHGDHFHVDVLRRKGDYRICQ